MEIHHFVEDEIGVCVKPPLYFLALVVKVTFDVETVFEAERFDGVIAVAVESAIKLFATSIAVVAVSIVPQKLF